MPKIVEIRKIGKEIKEIKPKKEESLEEEVEEKETENFAEFISGRKRNFSSTLSQSDISGDIQERASRISKEDEEEINFKPSYKGGGNPYKEKKYTPVGSAESSRGSSNRHLGERSMEQRSPFGNNMAQQEEQWRGAGSPETGTEREYISSQEHSDNEKRRRADF